jgi:DNA mismatch repair protein MutS
VDAQTVDLPQSGPIAGEIPVARWASLLFRDPASAAAADHAREPDCFRDLRLDSVVGAVVRPYAQFRLEPLFHSPLTSDGDVRWRQQIAKDFQRPAVADALRAFAESQARMRASLAAEAKAYHPLQKLRCRFDARAAYAEGVAGLVSALTEAAPASEGLRDLHGALIEHVASRGFQELWTQAIALADRLDAIRYSVRTEGAYVDVGPFVAGPDYGAEVAALFERFRQTDGSAPRFRFEADGRMTQLEEQILERVARLNAPLFSELSSFCARHAVFCDPLAQRIDRELHFYLSYLEFAARLAPLAFSFPMVSETKAIAIAGGFDLALAATLEPGTPPVLNDLHLSGGERTAVVTGPNQGGKTTFARMVGQVHYLALLGLPVPAASATLFLCDTVFTHFERQESIGGPGGKLHDDMVRIHAILERASPRSLVILNEIFTSTTLEDASRLSRAIAAKLLGRDILSLWVTFLDELARLSDGTVSMVAEVAADDPAVRTYRIARRPSDGIAHALALAEKYGLTEQCLRQRLAR